MINTIEQNVIKRLSFSIIKSKPGTSLKSSNATAPIEIPTTAKTKKKAITAKKKYSIPIVKLINIKPTGKARCEKYSLMPKFLKSFIFFIHYLPFSLSDTHSGIR